MSFKRKRQQNPVLEAAQLGGDPARSAYVGKLIERNPYSGRRIAQSSLSMPAGRSGIRHVMKHEASKGAVHSSNKRHVHYNMRKYYLRKKKNGIRAHMATYAG